MDFKISDDYALNQFTWDGTEILAGIKGVGSPGGYSNGAGLVSDLAQWLLEDYPTIPLGYKTIPIRNFNTNDQTVLDDGGKAVLHPSSDTTARNFTIADGAHGASHPVGTVITIINQDSAGVLTILAYEIIRMAGAGTTGARSLDPNGIATAIKISNSEWIISGVGLS